MSQAKSSPLKEIQDDFEKGRLRAFGEEQDEVLRAHADVRRRQVQLSLKQVAMLGTQREQTDADIDELSSQLADIARALNAVLPDEPMLDEDDDDDRIAGKKEATSSNNNNNNNSNNSKSTKRRK